MQIPVLGVPAHVVDHAGGHEPVAQGRGHAAAHGSQLGQAQLAVDEHIVAGHVERQPQQAHQHGRTRTGIAFQKAAHVHEQHHARQAEEHGTQIPGRQRRQLGIQAEQLQMEGKEGEHAHQDQRQQAREPEALPQQMRGALLLAAAHQMGHHGGQGQQAAHAQQGNRHPDGARDGHGGHVRRAGLAGHGRVHEVHAHLGDLRHQHGQAQRQEAAGLIEGKESVLGHHVLRWRQKQGRSLRNGPEKAPAA